MIPTVGRSVHYHFMRAPGLPDGGARHAVITECSIAPDKDPEDEKNYAVCLFVVTPTGFQFINAAADYSAEPAAGCWSWPPRK